VNRHLTRTRSGLLIGVAYQRQRPLHTFTTSEEQLQRALLAKPRCVDWSGIAIAVFLVAALAAALFIGPRGA
jgi:hypothetical protein